MRIDWKNYSDHDAEKDNVLTFLSLEFILQMAVSYHSKCIGWLAIFFINTVESTFKTIYLSYCYILESWQKINGEKAICFGAKDNQYGSFNMTKSGRVKTMKLIHRSESVRCNYKTISSYWGCTSPVYGENLMTIITDANKKAILPPAEDLKPYSDNREYVYSLPGYHHNSNELVFRNLVNPLSVSSYQEMQIWYGQDWKDYSEENNSGKTCVDVYAWYEWVCPLEILSSIILKRRGKTLDHKKTPFMYKIPGNTFRKKNLFQCLRTAMSSFYTWQKKERP